MTTDQEVCPRCDHAWGWHRSRWGFILGAGEGGRAAPCRYDTVNPCRCRAVPPEVSFGDSFDTAIFDLLLVATLFGLFVALPVYFATR